ncbi:L-type lectin-domain containing receptor kinase IX.1 [Vitis vinifera]|uniref:L-type lectin-domain containing receptor kinase IX.1 n=1 Tax=Vitis vinifera TaxID=29760 RepID=A0A438I751_VITVI|nr:L-type lectin-domain containing receptor kinase IX.1 [Vitis vinifera]
MVVCNAGIAQLHSNTLPLLHIFMVSFFLSLMIPSASSSLSLNSSLSFSFNDFDPNGNQIHFEGQAYCSGDKAIYLTRNQQEKKMNDSWGRATYHEPFHLWDKASKRMADFSTNFSFGIDPLGIFSHGDGLAFFLAPYDTQLPSDVIGGGGLGLVSSKQALNSNSNNFFAVEFDTYQNDWDPKHDHVGININSMKSVENMTWWSHILGGKINHVSISYASSSKNLSVIFGTDDLYDDNTTPRSLYYKVNLRNYLPEFVTIGFSSATTGYFYEINVIYSWSFSSSNLQISDSEEKKAGLVVGLSVGVCALVAGLGLFCFCLWKKRISEKGVEDPDFDLSMVEDFAKGTGPRKFTRHELVLATNNFAEAEKLGEGGFGGVYKGFLRNPSSYIAVKRVSRGSEQGVKEYASEVEIISRLRHRNLVQLMGWCHKKRELLLVYDFMPNGFLASHLFEGKTLLTWAMRYKIATGLASQQNCF